VKVLIVDDERLARARLARMIARVPGAEVAGEAESGDAALVEIARLAPDVVLLDVDMPGMDGLSLAERPGLPPIVFTTAHVHFAADAFDVDAVDFLIKPVAQERLERALERARRRRAGAEAAPTPVPITLHGPGGQARFVDPRRAVAFRALDKYTAFVVDGEELLARESLDALEVRLGEAGFARAHRAALVRLDAIAAIDRAEGAEGALVARLSDGSTVEVSRRHAPALRRALGLRR
jgi:DNA-binding LytR/AlgR family response regulator